MDKKIICGVATIPNRGDSLGDTVTSIINQVDELIIYQNGFKKDYPIHSNFSGKIKIYSSLDTGIDMGDGGKFYKIGEYDDAYYFSIDDDLIYPYNYVSTMIEHSKNFNDEFVLTHHGRDINGFNYNNIKKSYRCLGYVNSINDVTFPGTGVSLIPTKNIKFNFKDIHKENMCDIWLGKYCYENGKKVKVLPHNKGWIKHSTKIDLRDTIDVKVTSRNNDYRNNILKKMYE